jgi:uncharacterized protein (PEP-CTERM system associated)
LGFGESHAQSWKLTPSIAATETYSSNMALSSANQQSGLVTSLDPSIVLTGTGSHLKVHADLTVSNVDYSSHPEWAVHQNKLTSYATLEAVDQWLFVDASANIGHRNVSSFTPVATNIPVAGQAQVETRTTQLSPYIRGNLANVADYVVRINNVNSQSDDPNYANTTVTQSTGNLKKSPTGGAIGWFADMNATQVNNSIVGSRADDRYRIGIMFPVFEHVNLSVSTGQESTDFSSANREVSGTPGLGIEWTPNPRFQAAALAEQRFFGTAHQVQIAQTTPRTAWRFLASRDVSVLPNLLPGYNPGSVDNLLSELLVSSIPDPDERALAVRNRMQQIGAAANLIGNGGSETSRFYVDDVQQASVAFKFRRDTLTFSLMHRVQQLLSFAPVAVDIFTASGGIEEKSLSAAWVHRATPETDLIGSAIRVNSQGQSAPFLESTQTSISLAAAHRLNRSVTASMGFRRTAFDGGAAAIQDNAVFITVGKQF